MLEHCSGFVLRYTNFLSAGYSGGSIMGWDCFVASWPGQFAIVQRELDLGGCALWEAEAQCPVSHSRGWMKRDDVCARAAGWNMTHTEQQKHERLVFYSGLNLNPSPVPFFSLSVMFWSCFKLFHQKILLLCYLFTVLFLLLLLLIDHFLPHLRSAIVTHNYPVITLAHTV